MKRLPHVAILLVAVALVAADKGEKKKGDAEKIQGKWKVVESYYKGEKRDKPVGQLVVFSGSKVVVTPAGSDKKVEAGFELRPDKKPPELDMILKSDSEEMTAKAIYELSGDTLKICFLRPSEKGRPEAVGTAADDERRLLVLKRVKGDKGDGQKPQEQNSSLGKQPDEEEITTEKLRRQYMHAKTRQEWVKAKNEWVANLKSRYAGIDASVSGPRADEHGARFSRLMMEWNPIHCSAEDLKSIAGKPTSENADMLYYAFDNGTDGTYYRFTISGGTIHGVEYIPGE